MRAQEVCQWADTVSSMRALCQMDGDKVSFRRCEALAWPMYESIPGSTRITCSMESLARSRPHGLFRRAARRPVRHQARRSNHRRALHTQPVPLPDYATKALGDALGIDEKACDLAPIIDAEDCGRRGARDIDGAEHAPVQE